MSTKQLCVRAMFECADQNAAATLMFRLHEKSYTHGVHCQGVFVYATIEGGIVDGLKLLGNFVNQDQEEIAIACLTPDTVAWDPYSLHLLCEKSSTDIQGTLQRNALKALLYDFRAVSRLDSAEDEVLTNYICYTSLGTKKGLTTDLYRDVLTGVQEAASTEDAANYMASLVDLYGWQVYTNLLRCIVCVTSIQRNY